MRRRWRVATGLGVDGSALILDEASTWQQAHSVARIALQVLASRRAISHMISNPSAAGTFRRGAVWSVRTRGRRSMSTRVSGEDRSIWRHKVSPAAFAAAYSVRSLTFSSTATLDG